MAMAIAEQQRQLQQQIIRDWIRPSLRQVMCFFFHFSFSFFSVVSCFFSFCLVFLFCFFFNTFVCLFFFVFFPHVFSLFRCESGRDDGHAPGPLFCTKTLRHGSKRPGHRHGHVWGPLLGYIWQHHSFHCNRKSIGGRVIGGRAPREDEPSYCLRRFSVGVNTMFVGGGLLGRVMAPHSHRFAQLR